MKECVSMLLLTAASGMSITVSQPFRKTQDHIDRCIPLTRPSSVETARCVEDSVPVARLTDLILHQLHWHSFILISDNTTDLDEIPVALKASGVSVKTVEAKVATSGRWIADTATTSSTSWEGRRNILLVCSFLCARKLLEQVDDFDANSRGRSAIWMTWTFLIVPHCENGLYDSVTWSFNTSVNNVAMLTPLMRTGHFSVKTKTQESGHMYSLCPSVLSLSRCESADRHFTCVGHFSTCGFLRYHGNQDIFPNMNYGFNGQRLIFVVKAWSIFVFDEQVNGQKTWRGSYVDLLEYLSRRLNFTYSLIEAADDKWGSVTQAGQWDGVLGMVHRGEAVAAWIPHEVSQERAVDFDFPSPTDYSAMSFIYLPPDTDDKLLLLLLQPLSWQVLLCVAVSVPLVTLLLWLMESVSPVTELGHVFRSNKMCVSSLHRSLRLVTGALFAEASPDDWRWGGSRLMVGSWWLVTVVLAAAYSGSLVAHLSLTPPYLPFRSLEDVVKQTQYKWGTLANASLHNLVKISNISVYRKVKEGLDRFTRTDPSVLAADSEIHFRKVKEEKYVFIGPLNQLSLWQRGDCRLVTGQREVKQAMMAPVFPKESALTAYFSDVIDELRANGLIEAWNTQWMDNSDCAPSQEHSTVISLGHLQGVFYVAVSGLGLSLLLLLTERLVYTRNKRTLVLHNALKVE